MSDKTSFLSPKRLRNAGSWQVEAHCLNKKRKIMYNEADNTLFQKVGERREIV